MIDWLLTLRGPSVPVRHPLCLVTRTKLLQYVPQQSYSSEHQSGIWQNALTTIAVRLQNLKIPRSRSASDAGLLPQN